MPQWMGQTISCSDVGQSCMGNARGHGYPSACWDLQRSVWLSCIRVRDRDVPGGLRSCRWNLCIVHFGRNYFLGHWQQEVLKSTGKYYWREFSGKKKSSELFTISNFISMYHGIFPARPLPTYTAYGKWRLEKVFPDSIYLYIAEWTGLSCFHLS